VKKLLRMMEEMWEITGEGNIPYLVSKLLERSSYLKYIHSMTADGRERSLANVRKLFNMASKFEKKHIFSHLSEFVQYVRFSMDQAIIEAEAESESEAKSVQIMTIHQAKGLEFDTVFVINTGQRSFPTDPRHPMFILHKEDGLIIKIPESPERGSDRAFKLSPYDLKKNSHLYEKHDIIDYYQRFKSNHLKEERRIWYVAVTRAKHRLYLSCPKDMDGNRHSGRIDFFQEILDGFANAGSTCEIRSFRDSDREDEAELPLWKSRDKPIFANLGEAEEYGKRLIDLVTSWKD
jgi:superfamily I DNA/RNA helicase